MVRAIIHKGVGDKKVRYHVGGVMIWGCFAVSGTSQLTVIDGTMNLALYKKIQLSSCPEA